MNDKLRKLFGKLAELNGRAHAEPDPVRRLLVFDDIKRCKRLILAELKSLLGDIARLGD